MTEEQRKANFIDRLSRYGTLTPADLRDEFVGEIENRNRARAPIKFYKEKAIEHLFHAFDNLRTALCLFYKALVFKAKSYNLIKRNT